MNGLLFIDDEEGIRRSIVRALRHEPYKTYTAETGEEGIDFISENASRVSAVISDYKMPGLNGLDTLATIGRINPEITRIILTGYATMEAAIQATNEGIDGFLTKPFENAELRLKLHEIHIRKRLRQFVPEPVYIRIFQHPHPLSPSFHEASILFSDIRGFTRMTQEVHPEVLASFLNDSFFTPMGEIAHQHNGMLDKHIGDSIMVTFGTPVPLEKDAEWAVKAAIAMQLKARDINQLLERKNGLRLHLGIGISTGTVLSGIIGSLRKKEFTSIGMAVNIAARLQSIAKAGEIIISEATFNQLPESIDAFPVAPVNIKGIRDPVPVFKVNADA